MPNIIINNFCNLKCPYCFAENLIKEDNKIMSLENYELILEFFQKNLIYNFGILGGEPTLHPEFKQILIKTNNFLKKNNGYVTLFTNGINLQNFIPYIGKNIRLLINYNNPNNMTNKQFYDFISNINYLKQLNYFEENRISFSCNLYLDCNDYYWIWDMIDKYQIKDLRISVVSPGGIYTNQKNQKNNYFIKMKPIFLNFCKKAKEKNITLNLDCGHIPLCYFSDEEINLINKTVINPFLASNCFVSLDITPDLKITPCLGYYNPIPLDFNSNIEGLKKYFLYNYNIPKALHNNQGKCGTCDKLQNFQCQGGCLAFSSLS